MIKRTLKEIASMINASVLDEKYNDINICGINIDSRKIESGNLFIPMVGTHNGHSFIKDAINNNAAATLWNKNEPNPPSEIGVILVDDTLQAMQQLAKAYREQLKTKVIGIAGSNGKTSTKDILAALLSEKYKTQKTIANYNNELGVPITLLNLDEDCEIAVVEMGMEKMNELLFLKDIVKPDHAILTNVGSAHLENFDSMENLATAKVQIADCINDNGLFIYNGDDEHIKNALKNKQLNRTIRIKTFGHTPENNIYVESIDQSETGIAFKTNGEVEGIFEVDMLGKHQALNAVAAFLAAKEYGISDKEIKNGLKNIQMTGLRNEIVKIKNCTILNDTYKSNPDSVIAAIETFEKIKSPYRIVVLGDMLGLGQFEKQLHIEIGKKLSNYYVDELVVYGELANYIAEGAHGYINSITHFTNKNEMTEYLSKFLNKECSILIKASRSLQLDEVVDKLKLY